MGAWGYDLLECDDAYDAVYFLDRVIDEDESDIIGVIDGHDDRFTRDEIKDKLDDNNVLEQVINDCYDDRMKLTIYSIYCSLGLYHLVDNNKINELIELELSEIDDWDKPESREQSMLELKDKVNSGKEFTFSHKGLLETILTEEGK